MPKALSILGMVVAAFTLLIFGFDLALGIPFSKAAPTMDIGLVICGSLLAYLSWAAFREQE